MRDAAAAGLWTLGSDAGGKLAILAASVIVARTLAPAAFGLYVALVALGLVAGLMWDAGLSTLALRDVGAGLVTPRGAMRQGLKLRALAFPAWLLVTLAAAALVAGGRDLPAVIPPVLVASAGISIHTLAIGAGRGSLEFRATGLSLAVGRLAALLGTAAIAAAGGAAPSVAIYLWCVAGGEVVTLGLALLALPSRRAAPLRGVPLSYRRSLPYAANTFLAYAYNRLDVLIVGSLAGPLALAAYAPASRLQDAMLAIPGVVTTVMTPNVARLSAAGRGGVKRIVQIVASLGFLGGAVISASLWFLAPTLILLLLGPGYEASIEPTRVLVWFLPFAMVSAPVIAFLIGSGRGPATTVIFLVSFIVAVGMNLALDWWAGAVGAAFASFLRDPASSLAGWILLRTSAEARVDLGTPVPGPGVDA